jgi:serine/threonine protein kinase
MSSIQKTEGKDLGDYVLLKKKIGSGSYADVYQGYRKSDKETVAIKVISKNKLNQKLNSYLELEIQTLKKIDHSSVIKLYEVQRVIF